MGLIGPNGEVSLSKINRVAENGGTAGEHDENEE